MPRKPGFNYDTTKPVAQANDILRLRDQHQTIMNYNAGYMGLASIDGQAYPTITQKGLKDVFESCFVPLDDGNKILVGADKKTISQRGYGNVIKRKPVGVPKGNRPGITHQDVDIIHHPQNAVFTDFPKGSGKTDTQIVWRDGTYDEAVLSATKQPRGIIPDQTFADILRSNPRLAELALSSQVGAVPFGDALARKEIEEYFNAEKKEFDKNVLVQLGFTDAEAEARINAVARERMISDIAKRLGLSEKASRNVLDLVIPGEYRTSRRADEQRISETDELERRYAEAREARGLPAEPGYRASASSSNVLEEDLEAEQRGRASEELRIARNRRRAMAHPNAEAIRNEIQARLRSKQLATQQQPSSERGKLARRSIADVQAEIRRSQQMEREANRFATATEPFVEASRRAELVRQRIADEQRRRQEMLEAFRNTPEQIALRRRIEARANEQQRRRGTLAYLDNLERKKNRGRK